MRAKEFIQEKKKKRSKWPAYGPGPYGYYGYDSGSNGDGGVAEQKLSPAIIHRLADKKGIKWDNDSDFLSLCQKLTGVSHLDNMDQDQLKTVLNHLKTEIQNEERYTGNIGIMELMKFLKDYPDLVPEYLKIKNDLGARAALQWALEKMNLQLDPIKEKYQATKFQKNLIPLPKGTVKVDVSDTLDWYNLGMNISDLDDADPSEFGQGPPQTVIAFGSEPEEHKYLRQLKRLGLKVHDIDENFADGRNPGRKGLAKRSGVPTKASVSRLRQIAKSSSGEKQRMAHWLANMKSGRAKKK